MTKRKQKVVPKQTPTFWFKLISSNRKITYYNSHQGCGTWVLLPHPHELQLNLCA
jgi:hypothetical protein